MKVFFHLSLFCYCLLWGAHTQANQSDEPRGPQVTMFEGYNFAVANPIEDYFPPSPGQVILRAPYQQALWQTAQLLWGALNNVLPLPRVQRRRN